MDRPAHIEPFGSSGPPVQPPVPPVHDRVKWHSGPMGEPDRKTFRSTVRPVQPTGSTDRFGPSFKTLSKSVEVIKLATECNNPSLNLATEIYNPSLNLATEIYNPSLNLARDSDFHR